MLVFVVVVVLALLLSHCFKEFSLKGRNDGKETKKVCHVGNSRKFLVGSQIMAESVNNFIVISSEGRERGDTTRCGKGGQVKISLCKDLLRLEQMSDSSRNKVFQNRSLRICWALKNISLLSP